MHTITLQLPSIWRSQKHEIYEISNKSFAKNKWRLSEDLVFNLSHDQIPALLYSVLPPKAFFKYYQLICLMNLHAEQI